MPLRCNNARTMSSKPLSLTTGQRLPLDAVCILQTHEYDSNHVQASPGLPVSTRAAPNHFMDWHVQQRLLQWMTHAAASGNQLGRQRRMVSARRCASRPSTAGR